MHKGVPHSDFTTFSVEENDNNFIDSYQLERMQKSMDKPFIELERNNLLKNVGFKLMAGFEDALAEGDLSTFEMPTMDDIWEDLQFTIGVNPYPGYEVDITKGQFGRRHPFASDWKVDVSVPLPDLGF
tara:strand:- start:291 stop:674 length:384 start_codon:yes stop_codon:yes gene_type:complete